MDDETREMAEIRGMEGGMTGGTRAEIESEGDQVHGREIENGIGIDGAGTTSTAKGDNMACLY
jgi:hypothetical protein